MSETIEETVVEISKRRKKTELQEAKELTEKVEGERISLDRITSTEEKLNSIIRPDER